MVGGWLEDCRRMVGWLDKSMPPLGGARGPPNGAEPRSIDLSTILQPSNHPPTILQPSSNHPPTVPQSGVYCFEEVYCCELGVIQLVRGNPLPAFHTSKRSPLSGAVWLASPGHVHFVWCILG